jgi:CRP-like cAMP-binding protein/predicted acylesterase/phospholipase RssA
LVSALESIDAGRVEMLSKIPPLNLLATDELAEVLGVCEEIFLETGAVVFQAGDPGDAFFVVLSGRLKVWRGGQEGGQLGELTPGELFGERALILGEPRSATVEVAEDCKLLVLRRDAFDHYFASNPKTRVYIENVRRKHTMEMIARDPLCSLLEPEAQRELETVLETRVFGRGEDVYTFGYPSDALYFVVSGELEVWMNEANPRPVARLGPPNSFGELGLLMKRPRMGRVRVLERAQLLVLKAEHFDRFFLGNQKALAYFEGIRSNRALQTLERIPLFSYLSAEELSSVRRQFTEVTFEKDDVVCRAGDEGDAFYVVRTGALEVWGGEKGRELLDTIGPSGFFGEESLILGEPRRATIKASEQSRLLVLKKDSFERFFLHNPSAVGYLDEVRHRRRAAALERVSLFKLISPEELATVQKDFVEQTFRKGEAVCRAGEESNTFYIVLSGELDVWSSAEPPTRLARLGTGDFFGELAVILGEKRSATVVASQRTQVLGLPKEAFTRLFLRNPRSLEYFSRIMCQRLSSAVTGERVGEGPVQVAVLGAPGLCGASMVAKSLAALLAELTGTKVLLVRLQRALPNERLAGLHLHLSTIDRTIDAVRRSFEERSSEPVELSVGFEPNGSTEQYGGQLSDLVNRVRTDFPYQVFDLPSNPPSMLASAPWFADVIVEIVENGKPEFPAPAHRSGVVVRYPVINLKNPQSRRVPISACAPFVIPHQPGLGAEAALALPRSPGAIPLWRLARKILGRSVGLALGGGAAFGISHLGVLQVLERNSIPIDLIVGCSIGSLVAVSYAAGFSLDEMMEKAHEMGQGRYVASGLDFTFTKPGGILGGDRLKSRFTPLLGSHRTFDDLLIPCRTVATDIRSGELVSIGRGRLEDAYRASSSVPMVLSPEALDGRVLVDGGVADPVPAETVRHMGADLCIAVPVVPPLKKGVETAISKWSRRLNVMNPFAYLSSASDMPNAFDITMNSLQTLQHELGLYKVISADVSILPELSDFTWTDFDRSKELIERGVEAAESALPALRKMLRP